MGSLANKAALVTGAASGIGLATADLLEREGALVYRADIASGAGVHLDVTDEASWVAALSQIPKVDIFVHSAGIASVGLIEGCSLEDWRRVLAVNLDGAFLGLKHVMPLLRKNLAGGSVILIGSASGVKPAVGAAAYCSSKAALGMLAKCAALEAKDANVRVNWISPAGVVTPMWKDLPELPDRSKHPLQRMAFPDEVAEAILFLAGDGAAGITGAELRLDAGYTL
jgi:NAD(P)-dependent dehydrogenase (short-subunit alcohol dehydrogenase family)